jgi:hypothetical protein
MPDFLLMAASTLRRTMKELLEAIAKALVDNPDQVQVRAIEAEQVTVFELRVQRKSDRARGAHGRFHPHYLGCGGHETAKARQGGNPGVEPEPLSFWQPHTSLLFLQSAAYNPRRDADSIRWTVLS